MRKTKEAVRGQAGPKTGPNTTPNQVIGWQSVSLNLPQEWSLVGFGGDERAGNIRIDSADPDDNVQSLQLRWAQSKGGHTQSDLEARIAPLLKEAQRSARRARGSAQIETHPICDKRHADRDVSLAFSWARTASPRRGGEQAAAGRIWHCKTCGRVVIAQAYCQPGAKHRAQAQELMAGIACHTEEIGWRTWGLYGLLTSVPADYALGGQQLMNVYLQLQFQRGQSADQIFMEQWNLANVQLKGMYLDEWFEGKSSRLVGSARLVKAAASAQGHPALLVTGRRRGAAYWTGEAAKHLARLKRPASHYAALLWECPQTNRAYMVQSFSRQPANELVEEIVGRTMCHPDAGQEC